MLVTASLALAMAAATGALLYFRRITVGSALLVWLSGFTAAGTGLAGPVNALLNSFVTAISNH